MSQKNASIIKYKKYIVGQTKKGQQKKKNNSFLLIKYENEHFMMVSSKIFYFFTFRFCVSNSHTIRINF